MSESPTNKLVKFLALFCGSGVLLLLLFPLTTTAAFTKQINYQGKLTNSVGSAVANGAYDMEFKLYTASTGGSAIWTESRNGANQVTVTSGLFSIMLGSVSSLEAVDFNQPLYLSIKINSDLEMSPRKVLGAVSNAFNSEKFDGLATTSFLRSDIANATGTINNLNSQYLSVSGNVGIGTTTPGDKLVIDNGGIGVFKSFSADGSDYSSALRANVVVSSDVFPSGLVNAAVYGYATSSDLFQEKLSVGVLGEATNGYGVIGKGQIGVIGFGASNDYYTGFGGSFSASGVDSVGVNISMANGAYGLKVDNASTSAYSLYSTGGKNYLGNDTEISGDLTVDNGHGISLGGDYRTTWPVTGGGGGGDSFWATTSSSLIGYPSLAGNYAIVIGASATTSNVRFEVAGNTKLTGDLTISGNATLSSLANKFLSVNGAGQIIGTTTPLLSYTETDPFYALASSTLLRYGTSTNALTEGLNHLFYTDGRVGTYITSSTTLPAFLNYWTKTGNDLSYLVGKVGIGTTTFSSMLNIQGTPSVSALSISSFTGVPAITTDIYGNVGFGTTTPSSNFSVVQPVTRQIVTTGWALTGGDTITAAGAKFLSQVRAGDQITVHVTSPVTVNIIYTVASVQSDTSLKITTGSQPAYSGTFIDYVPPENPVFSVSSPTSPYLTVGNSGLVGIGTSLPDSLLTVENNVNDNSNLFRVGTSSNPNIFTIDYRGVVRINNDLTTSLYDPTMHALIFSPVKGSNKGASISLYKPTPTSEDGSTGGLSIVESATSTWLLTKRASLGQISGPTTTLASNSFTFSFSTNFGNSQNTQVMGLSTSTRVSIGLLSNYFAEQLAVKGTSTFDLLGLYSSSSDVAKFLVTANGDVKIPANSVCIDGDGSCTPSATLGTLKALYSSTGGSDLAENYQTFEADLSSGDIVSASGNNNFLTKKLSESFGIKKARGQSEMIGIIATAPGVLMGDSMDEASSPTKLPVALSGRVPTKVNLEGGNINVGDYITLSSVAGVGTKATSSTQTVGIALEPFNSSSVTDGAGSGKIMVFVNLGYSHIDSQISQGQINTNELWSLDDFGQIKTFVSLNLSNLDITNVRAITSASGNWSVDENGNLIVKKMTTDELCLGSTCVTEGELKTLLDKAGLSPIVATPPVVEPAPTSPAEPSSIETEPSPLTKENETILPDPSPGAGGGV
jgi:hypothetical protein